MLCRSGGVTDVRRWECICMLGCRSHVCTEMHVTCVIITQQNKCMIYILIYAGVLVAVALRAIAAGVHMLREYIHCHYCHKAGRLCVVGHRHEIKRWVWGDVLINVACCATCLMSL